ncbi:RecQ family ATP-dependent DNA helicase [Enterococcus rivorum]|uniref:Recombinase RecQ n=1 Tax=Enterococcus rivorum TaxID=762845 RepID=A0A1E5KY16_9ENTE|nr:RecQ family ATP-dependent DNA helicase [Enterococcus rivorum]MBP2099672.1 ATP-dependent DNA helicase RecQ [Enterococcus rivorum]OEH82698.1 recombinase RecQ [Enterococcus rivorum]
MDLEKNLMTHFGYSSFKAGQKEVITHLLSGKSTLAVLPTGTGKSLCYEYVGMLLEGLVIIVSPLLSLMEDQVRRLQMKNIGKPIAMNSSLTFFEKEYLLENLNDYKFLFLSPEMLFQEKVRQTLTSYKVGLFVVDEAHCVSQWGVDFRPEYSKLSLIQNELGNPLTLALTATATPEVREEIKLRLFSSNKCYTEVIHSINRENIGLIVNQTIEKDELLLEYIEKLQAKGIIYCSTRKNTEKVHEFLATHTSIRTAFYHGGMTPMERLLIQQQFILNQLDVLCATNAFGMGIDKPDIRFVIHYDCPDSLSNYVQEIGRAGRDGQASLAILLYRKGDERIHYFFQTESQIDRELLKTMVESPKINLEEAFPLVNEIQQKWLQGYLDEEYSLEELELRLVEKEGTRKRSLYEMMAYIQEETCRRNFIQKAFSETEVKMPQGLCCDCCGLSFDNYQAEIVQSPEDATKSFHWRQSFLRLFKDEE